MKKNRNIQNILLLLVLSTCSYLACGHVALTFPPARKYDLDFLDNSRTPAPCGMPKGERDYSQFFYFFFFFLFLSSSLLQIFIYNFLYTTYISRLSTKKQINLCRVVYSYEMLLLALIQKPCQQNSMNHK
jgi:hypothetical protein